MPSNELPGEEVLGLESSGQRNSMLSSIDLTAMPYYYRGRVFRMDISQTMKDEVVLHNWKMMKLERC